MTDQIITKVANIFMVITSFIFAQASKIEPIISQAFDQLFSLGLLMLVLFVLWREYRTQKEVNQRMDDELKDLVKDSIKSSQVQAQKNTELTDKITDLTDKISQMVEARR